MNKKNIVIVDDMVTNHLVFKSHLKDFPYEIKAFKDSELFLKQLTDLEPPDLFVLDIEMPGINGIELARNLRLLEKFQMVPIIFFSTLDDDKVLTTAFEVGAVDFISKAMKSTEVQLRVNNILRMEELKRKSFQLNKDLSSELKLNQILFRILFHDLANLLTIVDGNLNLSLKQLEEHPSKGKLVKCVRSMDQLKEILTSIKSITKTAQKIESTSIQECMEILEFIFAEKFLKKNIKFQYECEKDLSVKIPRAFLVHQIFSNFLSNALKFSPENSLIKVNIFKRDESIQCEIIDEGPGITAEIAEKILSEDQFYSTEGTYQEMGTGSGVKIAKYFIDKFSGQLTLHSSSEKAGTAVMIKFPIH